MIRSMESLSGSLSTFEALRLPSLRTLDRFWLPDLSMMDCILQLSTRQLVHSGMVSLLFLNKLRTVLITGQKAPTGTRLPWIADEISKVESLLSSFEQHKEALLDWYNSVLINYPNGQVCKQFRSTGSVTARRVWLYQVWVTPKSLFWLFREQFG